MPESPLPPTEALPQISSLVESLTVARKKLRMTQAELAAQAGLSRMTVQRLESNGLDPRLSTLYEMARVLGYTLIAVPMHQEIQVRQLLEKSAEIKGVAASTSPRI